MTDTYVRVELSKISLVHELNEHRSGFSQTAVHRYAAETLWLHAVVFRRHLVLCDSDDDDGGGGWW